MLIDASVHLSKKEWVIDDHVHLMSKGSDSLAEIVANSTLEVLRREKSDGASSYRPYSRIP